MPVIEPVSELRNYGRILEKVDSGSPVYLTKNGKGAYSIHSIDDDEEFEKAKAMVRLLTELNRGFRSGDEKGWISEDEVEEHFRIRRRIHRNLFCGL